MNEELIQNLVSAAESLSRSVDRAEEKLKTQKENNAKLQQLVFFLDSVAKRKERQVRETEVRVAKRKLRTSTMEMEMETKKREEKVREIELRAWLERDDRKFEQLKEKKRKALEKTTTDSSVTSALNALFEQREEEDQEDQEDVILFFGRRATPGKCKTRLAKDLTRILMVNEEEEEEEEERRRKGETMAARLYEFCTERVLRGFLLGREEMIRGTNVCAPTPRRRYRDGVMKKRLRLVFYVAEKEEVEKVREWLEKKNLLFFGDEDKDDKEEEEVGVVSLRRRRKIEIEVKAQDESTNDLGLRMIRAINDEISSYASRSPEDVGERSRRVFHVVGTDYPDASWERLEESTKKMRASKPLKNDAPKIGFGKAEDGGFWHLSTTCRLSESLFGSEEEKLVRWSTNHTLEDAKNAARKVGMVPHVEDSCDPLYDIDTLEDVRNWMIATTTNRKEEKSSEVEEDEFTKLVGEVV